MEQESSDGDSDGESDGESDETIVDQEVDFKPEPCPWDQDVVKWNEGKAARVLIVTAWKACYDSTSEPNVKDVCGVLSAAWGVERGVVSGKLHMHLALRIDDAFARKKRGRTVLEILKEVFSSSGLKNKDIRVATKSTRYETVLRYVTDARHQHDPEQEAQFYCCDPPGTARKRSREELDACIQEAQSLHQLRKGETRGTLVRNVEETLQVFNDRQLAFDPVRMGGKLFGFERAFLELLSREPNPKQPCVHWIYPEGLAFPEMTRLHLLVRCILSRQKRSHQIAYGHSNGPCLLSSLSIETKVVFVLQTEDKPLSHTQLFYYGYLPATQTKCKHGSGWSQLLPARHVIVFADKAHPKGRNCEYARSWGVGKKLNQWAELEDLLATAMPEGGEPFLELEAMGCSGDARFDWQGLGVP